VHIGAEDEEATALQGGEAGVGLRFSLALARWPGAGVGVEEEATRAQLSDCRATAVLGRCVSVRGLATEVGGKGAQEAADLLLLKCPVLSTERFRGDVRRGSGARRGLLVEKNVADEQWDVNGLGKMEEEDDDDEDKEEQEEEEEVTEEDENDEEEEEGEKKVAEDAKEESKDDKDEEVEGGRELDVCEEQGADEENA